MVINGSPAYLSLLMFLVTVLVGALYLVWRKHLVSALFFAVASAFGAYVVVSSLYFPRHGTGFRQLSALSTATSIESAVNNFKSEYRILPCDSERISSSGPEAQSFLTVLLGDEQDTPDHRNPKGIRFLAIKEAKDRKGGMQFSEKGHKVEGVFDPWGNPYVVILDAKNEGKVHFTYGSGMIELPGKSVAVYSAGKDGKAGNPDDIKTWGN
jgi:hypothetical protein